MCKAILSKEDLNLYEAIRVLSDLKENPDSTTEQIDAAQKKLDQVSKSMTHVSEGGELSRMNWWTAEYGLIGELDSPKIFGAGLLSSVGESKWCLSPKVKKIPLSIDCLKQGYDITEPQPQLFVAKDFTHLSNVLKEMAEQMAYKTGGMKGLQKALQAKSLNTVQWSSGVQVSGELCEIIVTNENNPVPAYLKFQGPCQISFQEQQLPGHDINYHKHGFGSPVGKLKGQNKCLSQMSDLELKNLGLEADKKTQTQLQFESGIVVSGILKSKTRQKNQLVLLSFESCNVTYGQQKLFAPEWGTFDMAVGETINSVFGGPADRRAFGETEDFVALTVAKRTFSESEKQLHSVYQELRELRESNRKNIEAEQIESIFNRHQMLAPKDWLLLIEIIELLPRVTSPEKIKSQVMKKLDEIQKLSKKEIEIIKDGLSLAANI